jgi:ATP-dependent Clp protease ATP-binding subunit ClpA
MFERFEPAARQAIADARVEAGRAGQDKIHSEHVLIGLLAEPGNAADALSAAGLTLAELRARLPRGGHAAPDGDLDPDALASLGIDLDQVRRATDAAFGPGALERAPVPGRKRLPLGDDTKQTLAGALKHASRHGHWQITSGHVLVGILDQPRNGARTLLDEAGTDLAALRADIERRIGSQP